MTDPSYTNGTVRVYLGEKSGKYPDGNQVVVARATELLKVSTGLVDKSQLQVGQYVWVHPQTYAIVEGSSVRNEGVIASFSRALTEGLSAQQTDAQFNEALDEVIQSIFEASNK